MKSIVSILVLLSFNTAFASMPSISNSDFPTESGWAKAMTKKACKVKMAKSDYGVIEDAKSGVIYTVYNKDGVVKASAWAKSTFAGAKKACLVK